MDYTFVGTGSISGFASGTDFALNGGNFHTLPLVTNVPSAKNGTITSNTSSQDTSYASVTENMNIEVLGHVAASFDEQIDIDVIQVDFDVMSLELGLHTHHVYLHNLELTGGTTTDLDVDLVLGSGDTSKLNTSLAKMSNLVAGTSHPFSVKMETSEFGDFSTNYTVFVSDQNLPGKTKWNNLGYCHFRFGCSTW